ncbi:MAG: hypothetical protein HRT67_08490 [Flavobacteriaceae bacterium]|nr:hypothetical protein [Flavobacteriaceae bacterium]
MELFIEIVFRWLIVRILGIHTRYLFFKLIGKKKSMDYLSGVTGKIESPQDFYNAVTGLIIFCLLSVGIAYIVFS